MEAMPILPNVRVDFGRRRPIWPTPGRFRPNWGRHQPKSNSGQHCPALGRLRPTSANLARNFDRFPANFHRRRPGIDQIWPPTGQFPPNLARNRPTLVRNRPNVATKFHQTLPGIVQPRPRLDRHLPQLARMLPRIEQNCPELIGPEMTESGRSLAKSGTISAIFGATPGVGSVLILAHSLNSFVYLLRTCQSVFHGRVVGSICASRCSAHLRSQELRGHPQASGLRAPKPVLFTGLCAGGSLGRHEQGPMERRYPPGRPRPEDGAARAPAGHRPAEAHREEGWPHLGASWGSAPVRNQHREHHVLCRDPWSLQHIWPSGTEAARV